MHLASEKDRFGDVKIDRFVNQHHEKHDPQFCYKFLAVFSYLFQIGHHLGLIALATVTHLEGVKAQVAAAGMGSAPAHVCKLMRLLILYNFTKL